MSIALSARESAQAVGHAGRSPDVDGGEVDVAPAPPWGRGTPVLFLHGWGVGPASYEAPIRRLREMGLDVYAPALPGFCGSPSLASPHCTFGGYAKWTARWLEAQGVDGPVVVVGHSFGGGLAVQFANDYPTRSRALLLCNAVGGFPWSVAERQDGTTVPGRPLWAWGRFLADDLFALPSLTRVLPALLGQAVPNLMSNPRAMWQVAEFVRRADLTGEIEAVSGRGTPVRIVWSDRDRLVPYEGFSALRRAAGVAGQVVAGNHSWLIAEPGVFADVALRALVEVGVFSHHRAVAG
ncbi:MAG: alpha/beta fold hydrolase [Acidimicrobiales bacterium]